MHPAPPLTPVSSLAPSFLSFSPDAPRTPGRGSPYTLSSDDGGATPRARRWHALDALAQSTPQRVFRLQPPPASRRRAGTQPPFQAAAENDSRRLDERAALKSSVGLFGSRNPFASILANEHAANSHRWSGSSRSAGTLSTDRALLSSPPSVSASTVDTSTPGSDETEDVVVSEGPCSAPALRTVSSCRSQSSSATLNASLEALGLGDAADISSAWEDELYSSLSEASPVEPVFPPRIPRPSLQVPSPEERARAVHEGTGSPRRHKVTEPNAAHASKSPVKEKLELVKQVDTTGMSEAAKAEHDNLLYLLERRWDADVGRRELVFRDLNEAATRGATRESPLKVIVANGTGLSQKRARGATGSDQRQKPLGYVYTALQAAPELDVVFVDGNEDYTSQSCPRPSCRAQCAETHEVVEMEYAMYAESESTCYRVLRCAHCSTVFERDYVGASNIGQVALFDVLTGCHLFSRGVESALGLGLRETHKTDEEKAQTKRTKIADSRNTSTAAKGPSSSRSATARASGPAPHANTMAKLTGAPGNTAAAASSSTTRQRRTAPSKGAPGKQIRDGDKSSTTTGPLGRTVAIKGDGNCAYRAIAHILCGDQEYHAVLRAATVNAGRAMYPTIHLLKRGATTDAAFAEIEQRGSSAAYDTRGCDTMDAYLDQVGRDGEWFREAEGTMLATALQQTVYTIQPSTRTDAEAPNGADCANSAVVTEFQPLVLDDPDREEETILDDQDGVTASARTDALRAAIEQVRVAFPLAQRAHKSMIAYNLDNAHFEVETPAVCAEIVAAHPALTDETQLRQLFRRTRGTEAGMMRQRRFRLGEPMNWSADALKEGKAVGPDWGGDR